MAPTEEAANQAACGPEMAASGPETASAFPLRWRKIFGGNAREMRTLRRWLAELLPVCSARDDVVTVAVEMATNAVKFTASGRAGWFAVEITWHGRVVRVAVADDGAPTGPRLIDDPQADHGRGLIMVRALSTRVGVLGDERGRFIFADI